MRKIESRELVEKKQKRNKIILGFILVVLLLFSSLGYAFYSGRSNSSGSSNSGHGGDSFEQGSYVNGLWMYQIGSEVFGFLSYIDLAKKVPVDMSVSLNDISGKKIYIDSENQLFIQEVSSNIGRYAKIQEACHGSCERDLQELTCDSDLIVIKESEEKKVYQDNKCIFIEGDEVSVDAFLYKILGLI